MKKRKLKKWVKVVLTILVMLMSLLIYIKIGEFGALAQSSVFYQFMTISGWFWLLTGQFIIYTKIWD